VDYIFGTGKCSFPFYHIIISAVFDTIYSYFDFILTRKHDHLRIGSKLLNLLKNFHSVFSIRFMGAEMIIQNDNFRIEMNMPKSFFSVVENLYFMNKTFGEVVF